MLELELVDDSRFNNSRTDNWWLMPLLQASYIVVFLAYTLWAVFLDTKYYTGTTDDKIYVSPLYSPHLELGWWPEGLSPALLFIWAPIGFRATCYYMRKVYYRAFFADPPACAVGEFYLAKRKYNGEYRFPFVLNNFHRYFFYAAFILAIAHLYEFIRYIFIGDSFVGTLIFGLDAIFLAFYVASCHSFKHLIGGGSDWFTGDGNKTFSFKVWAFIKKLNEKHHRYFWLSLTTVMLADVYVRLVAHGVITF